MKEGKREGERAFQGSKKTSRSPINTMNKGIINKSLQEIKKKS